MKIINYVCDGCMQQFDADDIKILDVPVNINLKESKIIKKDFHVCRNCYNPEVWSSLGSYENEFRLHVMKFLNERKWSLEAVKNDENIIG